MPRATRHYRLRIRNAADSADALILSSVSGGTNPYLTGPPQGDGQEIDPATGESSIGAYTIEAADVGEVVTAALVDGSGRQALIQRRAYIELSTDGGSTWPTVLIPGFVNAYRLVTPMRWAFTIGESRRIEYTRKVWGQRTDAFDQVSCLIGGPIKDGWGPITDYGGACFRVSAVDATIVTLVPHSGYFPVGEDTSQYEYVATDDDMLLPAYTRDRANELAAAEQALTATGANADEYTGITVLVQTMDGTEIDTFTPFAQYTPWGDVLLSELHELKLKRAGTAWSGSPPSVDDLVLLYIWRTTIDEHTPLHIDSHPIDILTDLWDEAGMAYDSTAATTARGLVGDNTRLRLRITSSWVLSDVTRLIGGLFGVNTRIGTDGELEVVTTRIRGIAAPSNSYDDDDLRSPDTVIFEVDEQSIYNTVTVEQLRFRRWQPGMGERAVDEIVALSRVRSIDLNSEGGGTPDSTTFGVRELRFTVPGEVAIDASGAGIGEDYFERALATEIFDRYGRGGVYATIAALPTITEKVGDELILDVSHLPNAGVRGGDRIMQVVRRTETPSGPQLLLLDSGPDSQFGTAPTFTVATGAADDRKYVDVTITNASALNTAGAFLRVEWAVASSEPTGGGTLLTQYMAGEIPAGFTTPAVDAGSHVWIRMQAFIPDQRPTSYTAWDDVDLTDLVAPSSLSVSAGSDPARITIEFTAGESDIPLDVFQRPQGDPAGEARLVDTLAPGSDRVTLTLVPGDSYTIGLRYRESPPFGGVSSTTETSFTVAGSPVTLSTPTNASAVGIKWATFSFGPAQAPYAVGLQVYSAIDEGFVEFELATETAVGSGTPGSYSLKDTRSVHAIGDPCLFLETAPLDGKLRYMRARHTRLGADASAYTDVVSVMPGDILAPAPAVDPLDLTGIVPVTLGGTGVADPTSGVLLLAAGADPTTELAPGAAGGYARSDGSTWARSGLLAADLTGTVASARLSGIYSGITGLGTQAQALAMGGYGITNMGTLAVGSKLIKDVQITITDNGLTDAHLGAGTEDIEYVIVCESKDAVIALCSQDEGGHGSAIDLIEVNSGTLADRWTLVRESSSAGSDLGFCYGTDNYYPNNTQLFTFGSGGNFNVANGKILVGTASNALMTVGVTVNQGAADNEVVTCKSSDVAHGITDITETNTFFLIKKRTADTGGARVLGISEDVTGMLLSGLAVNDNTTKGTGAFGYVQIDAAKKSGTGWGYVGANANLVVIRNFDSARWLVDEDGDTWQNGGIVATTGIFSGDLTIGDLGVFDSTDLPTDRQLLVYNDDAAKWQAEDIQLAWGGSDIKAALLADDTAVAFILADPGTGADSPAGAPDAPDAPTLYGAHESITLEVVGYSRPADFRYFEWRYSDDNFVGDDNALATTTSDKVVHARLDNATTYYYKVRATDRDGNSSAYSSVSSTTPTANGSQAFGVILAAEIGVSSLAAIQADIGIITAGQMRDSTNVYGINLGGAGGIPGTWTAGINFEDTAVDGMDRYINFYEGSGDGLDSFIKHERFELRHDGSATFYDVVDILEGTLTGGAFGDKHIFLRDPDLAHGMTDIVETDIAGAIGLTLAAGSGAGLGMVGFTTGNRGLSLGAVATTPLTAMGALAVMTFEAWKKSGASRGDVADDELAFGWYNGTTALMALWGDGSLESVGEFALTGEQTFNSTGTQNNVTMDDGVSVFNYTGGSATTITGFTGGYQGRMVYVVNAGVALTIANNNGGSSSGNRVYTGTGANITLSTQGGFMMRHDGTYWRILALSN